jgi:CHASE2 domain-containing sensor protein
MIMDFKSIMEQAGLPLLSFVLCLYFGIRLMLTHDSTVIRGKNKPPVKDEKEYTRLGGILVICLGIAMFVMAVLLFISVVAALVIICLSVIAFAVLWKRMNEKYGSRE